jgi:hypothetical protein
MVQKQAAAFERIRKEYHHDPLLLSLNDISPRWSKRLQNRLQHQQLPIPMPFRWLRWLIEITDATKCIVGEAHGFSSSYTNRCSECGRIGDRFSLYFFLSSHTKFEENKQRFIERWNEKHHTRRYYNTYQTERGRCKLICSFN